MNCYYLPDTPAIGICKSCGRGLSMEYAADVGNGLACKDKCEARVRLLNSIIDRNIRVSAVANTHLRHNRSFLVTCGILFCTLGIVVGVFGGRPSGAIFVALGVVFILKGIFTYTKSAKYPTQE